MLSIMNTSVSQIFLKGNQQNSTSHHIQRMSQTCPFQNFNGPFRENIKWFIQNCCDVENYYVAGHTTWSTLLVGDLNGVVFPLYIVEEDVRNTSNPQCDLCRFVGWGNHFMAMKRYHIIIPKQNDWNTALDDDSLKIDTHVLHGMIHCNGFGHILTLHGAQTDSIFLSPMELINLWDCLCTTLRTRKISVHDVSKISSMELRLIHAISHRSSLFGKWGYEFCGGSFGVTEQKYKRAKEILSSLDLAKISNDFGSHSESGLAIQHIIRCYKDSSKTQLLTFGDLFQFLLDSKGMHAIQNKIVMSNVNENSNSSLELPNNGNNSRFQQRDNARFEAIATKTDCRWPARRLEHAANIIARILADNILATQGSGMSRHKLREAARVHIGDTGLIDYVLKIIGDKVVGGKLIRRVSNPGTKTLEFSIETVEEPVQPEPEPFEPGLDAFEDMLHLFNNVLFGYPETHPVSLAVETILNSKYFVKEWKINSLHHSDNDFVLAVCQVMPSYNELETILTQPLPPGEVIYLPKNWTDKELKLQAQMAFRDTYFLTRHFVAKDVKINGFKSNGDGVLEFSVRGSGLDLETPLRYEGNAADGGDVSCDCGAKDDDGERMVRCDMCNVWQHTSCNNIQDDEVPPALFLCCKCKADGMDEVP